MDFQVLSKYFIGYAVSAFLSLTKSGRRKKVAAAFRNSGRGRRKGSVKSGLPFL